MSDRTQVSYEKNPDFCYLGNPLVLRANTRLNFTEAEVSEYLKCSRDSIYFAKNYCKVIHTDHGLVDFLMYPYQEEMFKLFCDYTRVICLTPRQAGKTTAVAIWLLWYALFHADSKIAILANKGAAAREVLSRVTLALENLPFFLQAGCKELNKGSITWENNSQIFCAATSGSSIRGKSVTILYCDEFSFVENAEEFYESTYPVVSSGKKSKVLITSTPKGTGNLFHKLWEGAVQGSNEYKPLRVYWNDVPGRDEEFKRKNISNTSQKQWDQEFEGKFLGSSNTLIDSETLLCLMAQKPLKEEFDKNLKIYKEPVLGKDNKLGHQYVISIDIAKGRGKDYSVATVIDISTEAFEQVAVFRSNEISPLLLPNYLAKLGKMYNDAYIICEVNNGGDVVANALIYDLEYENIYTTSKANGIETTAKTKRIGCSNLKDLLEKKKLIICDADTIREISTFIAQGDSFAASGKNNDDCVMTLVNFAYFIQTEEFQGLSDINIRNLLFGDMMKQIDDEVVPVGIFDDGRDIRGNNEKEDNWL